MKFEKPVVFLDLEATGVWPEKDRIIEIALIRIELDGSEKTFHARFNPEMKIPPQSIAIHHITDEDVKNAPTFRERAREVASFLEGADLGGFSLERLDIPLLVKEFGLAELPFQFDQCRLFDVQKIFVLKEPRDLETACRFYLKKDLENAHSAMADARATLDVFWEQLQKYPDLPREGEALFQATRLDGWVYVDTTQRFRWWNGEAYFNFGKKGIYGKSLREVAKENPQYLLWMLDQDFSPEVLCIASDALKGNFPKPKEETRSGRR
ncbi:MAG: 3'-5' exonuclease [Candidatus Omnitrophota bacterium]